MDPLIQNDSQSPDIRFLIDFFLIIKVLWCQILIIDIQSLQNHVLTFIGFESLREVHQFQVIVRVQYNVFVVDIAIDVAFFMKMVDSQTQLHKVSETLFFR